jgi:hypothetical protein
METTTARMIEKNAFIVLKYSLRTARVRLLDGRRDCAANRQLELHKRSQLFLRVHNETLSVIAICVCDQDRSPHRPETTSLSARWLVDDFS